MAIESAREAIAQSAGRDRELEVLLRLSPVLERLQAARAALEAGGPASDDEEQLLAAAGAVASLRDQLSGHRERAEQLRSLAEGRATNEERVDEALRALGSSWDRSKLEATTGWVALEDEARRLAASYEEAATELRTRRALVDDATPVPPPPADLEGTSSPTEIRAAFERLRELRSNLDEQRRLADELGTRGQPTAGRIPVGPVAWLVVALLVAVVAGAAAAAALANGDAAARWLSAVVAVLAGAGLVVLLVARRPRTGVGDDGRAPATDPRAAQLVHVAATVDELAAALGLEPAPSASDVEALDRRLAEARDRAEAAAAESRRHEEASERLRAATAAAEAAEREAERCAAALARLAVSLDLPAELSPGALFEAIALARRAGEHLAAAARIAQAEAPLRAAVEDYESQVRQLLDSLPAAHRLGLATGDAAGALEGLGLRVDVALRSRAERLELERTIAEGSGEIERSLGGGEVAERLRRELETSSTLEWEAQRAALAPQIAAADEAIEALVRRHQDAARALEELASSRRIAELELERAALESELEAAVERWTVLGLARSLVVRTLELHERERQPEVLRRAGERFSKVTGGRYVRLLPALGEGATQAIRVVAEGGSELDAAQLSRGTVEQLYLCLRLGLAETFAERGVALPLVLDDVLVNFEPSRAVATVEALVATAAAHQVLLFTCHPHLVELVRSVDPGCQVVELDRVPAGGRAAAR